MVARTGAKPALQPREWLLLAVLAAAFGPALLALAAVWASVDYQSHGFLVPLVSVWALYRERPRWARLEVAPDPRGLGVLGLALVSYLCGLASGLIALQGLALIAALAGLVLYTRGLRWLRALAFPIGFLVFMVPPPAGWITPAIVRLQILVSSTAVALLDAFSMQVTRDGNVLVLPGGDSLFVAEACSGVTSIVTLAPLSVLLAHYSLKRWRSRWILFAAVIPLAMAGNLVRVVATVAAARELGVAQATAGPLHEWAGLLTYVVACGLMLALGALLRRLESPDWKT